MSQLLIQPKCIDMYSARITRLNPTAFIILIDQSGSMSEQITFNSTRMTKAEAVALATNMLIGELINRSQRDDGLRDYFDIAVLGYGNDEVIPMLGSQQFIKTSILAQSEPAKKIFTRERILPSGQSIIATLEQKFWVEPKANGSTPMLEALDTAYNMAAKWCRKTSNRDSYPPTIFNITDGEASDADYAKLTAIGKKIRSLKTTDGNVLLLNIHLSSESGDSPVIFPSSKENFVNSKYTSLLYDMSSEMPNVFNEIITQMIPATGRPPYRGMSYNTSITDLIAMMNIGSISVTIMQ